MKNKNPKQKNTTDINDVTLSNLGKKIIKLIEIIKTKVNQKFNIELKLEIKLIGEMQ